MRPRPFLLLLAGFALVFWVGLDSASADELPDLTVAPENITLEVDGEAVNGSAIKDDDTIIVKVSITNEGEADADDALVEIYYYAKEANKTQAESEWLNLLYSKRNNFYTSQTREIYSNVDWQIQEGKWYVEVRVDYDEDDLDNGEILESNENNNDARYGELLRIKPDLAITLLRVDNRFAGDPDDSNTQTPNVDEQVTFVATITNQGAADVDRARLYLTADSSDETGAGLRERGSYSKYYYEFKIDAGETTTVRFRWYAEMGEWSNFRAEVNPSCSEYSIIDCNAGDGSNQDTDRMYDELGRYDDNVYPAGGAIFEQDGYEVMFKILPDFKIKKVSMDPSDLEVGENVEVTVTIENIGKADWKLTDGLLSVEFDDGAGSNILPQQVTSDILQGDDTEVKFTWTVPDEDRDTLFLTFTIDPGSGNFEIDQLDITNDESVHAVTITPEIVDPVEPGTPVAIAGDAVAVKPGETVQFNGIGTDDDGSIVLYEWDFDGNGIFDWLSEESGRITNVYNKEGTYTAVLRVTDDDGRTATDSRVITVGDGGGDDDDGFLPAPSLAASVAAVAVIALRRRF